MADSLNGPFERVNGDGLILERVEDKFQWDSYMVCNPAVYIQPDGSISLYYKSWDLNNSGTRKRGLASADKLEGPYVRYEGNPIIDFDYINSGRDTALLPAQVEDCYVFKEDNLFKMVMRDMGVCSPRHGLILSSKDGIKWSSPEVAYCETTKYISNEIDREKNRMERPQLLMKDGKPQYLFTASRFGKFGTSSPIVIKLD